MFSGRYAHEIDVWDNTRAWNGTPTGWSHYFRDNNVQMTTIGKLDFAPNADHGIEQEIWPGHRGSMDICALFRDQNQLKAELEASGRLLDELAKRGFERRSDKLINTPAAMPNTTA